MTDTNKPTRGEWNNNPCNLRITSANWLGKVDPSQDKEFEQFDSLEHGIRAAAKVLTNYYHLDGLSRLDEIISRWAPSSENNTGSYINDVAQRMGVAANATINLLDASVLRGLVAAIIFHENGRVTATCNQIENGIDEALA